MSYTVVPEHAIEYLTGTDQILFISLSSKPWPLLVYIPIVPFISEPPKHQGENVFSSTLNSMSEFV